MSKYVVVHPFGEKVAGDKITAAEYDESEIAYLADVGLIESEHDANDTAPRAKKVSTKSEG